MDQNNSNVLVQRRREREMKEIEKVGERERKKEEV